MERAQELGMEFAARNFSGHQVLVCTHDEGHNKSGNIHVHMVLNSIRMKDVERQPFMERDTDCRAGYKHHVTRKYFKYLLKDAMDLCQREGLHQVDLLSPAAVKITEEEYRAQKRGQENLDKLNAEIRAAQMIPRYTTFQTQKQFLRDAITETASRSSSLEEFRQILKEKYGIEIKEQRGVFSYLYPERNKYIRGRSLGTDYEKEHILELIRKRILEREQATAAEEAARTRARAEKSAMEEDARARTETEKTTVTFLGVRYSTVYDPSYDYYADPTAILFIHSDLQLVTDLQTCVKAQYSEAYADQVKLSNLQKVSRTICYIQEHGIGSREELKSEQLKAAENVRSSEITISNTENRLKMINEQIHYAGQYYSTKTVHKEYLHALSRHFYRYHHSEELDKYDAAVKYFKNHSGGRIPSMKDLKQEKEGLLTQKSSQMRSLRREQQYLEELKAASFNISWLLSTEKAKSLENAASFTKRPIRKRYDMSY